MSILQLFWAFIQVGLLSFGGGYAAMPLIQHQVVDLFGWLTLSEFTDIITISQMTPGPIGINCATFTGMKTAGLAGGVAATLGCVLPSCIIVGILAVVYKKYKNLSVVQSILACLRPAVVALIASAGFSILLLTFFGSDSFPIDFGQTSWIAVGLFAAALFVSRKWKINPMWIMLGSGVVGGVLFSFVAIPS